MKRTLTAAANIVGLLTFPLWGGLVLICIYACEAWKDEYRRRTFKRLMRGEELFFFN